MQQASIVRFQSQPRATLRDRVTIGSRPEQSRTASLRFPCRKIRVARPPERSPRLRSKNVLCWLLGIWPLPPVTMVEFAERRLWIDEAVSVRNLQLKNAR